MAVKELEINTPAIPHAHGGLTEHRDERFAGRRRCNMPASIYIAEHDLMLPCCIMDISATGAGISFDPSRFTGRFTRQTLPDVFWLCLGHDGSQVRCRVAWQTRDKYGVRFVSPMQPIERRRRAKPAKASSKSAFFGLMK